MFLKPKTTFLDAKALRYKRIIDIGVSYNTKVYYYYDDPNTSNEYVYVFDRDKQDFVQIEDAHIQSDYEISLSSTDYYTFGDYMFNYDITQFKWTKSPIDSSVVSINIQNADNRRERQMTRYIKDREFDYTIVSDVNDSEEQIIKGLITERETFDIRYSDDDLNLRDSDIVQIENGLYKVSDINTKILRLPKKLKYYFCTLTKLKVWR